MRTTDPERLREQLVRSPFLLIDGSESRATLATKSEMFKAIGGRAFVVMHALGALRGLTKLAAGQSEFSLTDIAKIAGVDYFTAHFWMREGIIVASVRPTTGSGRGRGPVFGFVDAFAAGIVGSLRRQGQGLEIARLVAPLFIDAKTQTVGQIAVAKRS